MLKVFAVRDVKADAYDDFLIVCPTVGLAKRSFMEAVAAPNSRLAKYVNDFMLYELGEFDPNSGSIKGLSVPVFIMSAVDAHSALKSEVREVAPEVVS